MSHFPGVKNKLAVFGVILPPILVADWTTKRWALDALADAPRPDFLGGRVPLTLVFNRGAAFGLSIGDDPRWFFIPVTALAMGLMVVLAVQSLPRDYPRLAALALIISGAVGNLVDRVRWDRGVVDFIGPVDLGFMHWPVFNVADMAISVGAVLLCLSFWAEERRHKRERRDAAEALGAEEAEESTEAGKGAAR